MTTTPVESDPLGLLPEMLLDLEPTSQDADALRGGDSTKPNCCCTS